MRAGIAGAGLVGRLLAWQLVQRGWHVTLFDKDQRAGTLSCGFTAAGMLSPCSEVAIAEPVIFTLGKKSLALWPEIIASLPQPVTLQQQGSLVVAHAQDQAELQHFYQKVSAKISDQASIKKIAAGELEAEINLAGFFLPLEGCVDNITLYQVLETALLTQDVIWHEQQAVEQVNPGEICLAHEKQQFDWVFDCRGLGAKDVFKNLRGVRGEVYWLHAPTVQITRPVRMLHPRYRIYVVPRPNDYYVIGATEIESEDFSPMSVRSSLELLSAAYSLHSGFAEARIIKSLVNCRPALIDNLPQTHFEQGLVRINGLYRHGYLLAPALIAEVLEKLD